ncbi:25206_t:CDS:2, partial [Gigaspora rosea]
INLVGNNLNAAVSNLNTDFMTLNIITFEYRESNTIGIIKSKVQPDQQKLTISCLSMSSFDPLYDYNFTYVKDIMTFMRVSYSGTEMDKAKFIVEEGYDLSKGKPSAFEPAEQFAPEFMFDGKEYVMVFQNRINPASLRIFC